MGGGYDQPLERGHVVKSSFCVFVLSKPSISSVSDRGLFRGRFSVFHQLNSDTWKRTNNGLSTKGPMRTPRVAAALPTRRSHGWTHPINPRVDGCAFPSLLDEHRACVRVCFSFALVAVSAAAAVARGPSGCVFSLVLLEIFESLELVLALMRKPMFLI